MPDHVPVSTTQVDPSSAAPDTVGAVTFDGSPTTETLIAPARANPSGLLPATCAVRYFPTSAEVDA